MPELGSMTETMKQQRALMDAGFSDDEIVQWQADQRKILTDAGFNQAQIDTEFGHPPLDTAPVKQAILESANAHLKPDTPDGQVKPVTDFMEALDAGFQGSVSGLLKRGKVPDKTLDENAPMASRIAATIGTLAGDAPFMVGGALAGIEGGPVTAAAGGFALPAGMRKVLMDAYQKGEVMSFADFWERASGAIIETTKGLITGAATGGAGKLAGALPIASPTAKFAAETAAEISTMVTVGKALEGEIPKAQDFLDAAVVVGGLKGSVKLASKARDVYAKAGVKPDELVNDLQKDVTIQQDLLAENIPVPRAYQKVTATFETGSGLPAVVSPSMPEVPAGHVRLYRGEAPETGVQLPPWLQEDPNVNQIRDTARGRWFTDDVELAKWYQKDAGEHGKLTYIDVPTDQLEQYRVVNNPEAMRFSLDPNREFFIPKELADARADFTEPSGAPGAGATGGQGGAGGRGPGGGGAGGSGMPPNTPPANEAEAQRRVLSRLSIGEPDAKDPLTFQKLYTDMIDDLNPIREAVKQATDRHELPTADDPYQLMRLTRGSFGRATQFLEYGTFDFRTYENNGRSFKEIMRGVDLDGFRAFIASRRALELNRRGIETGIDLQAAEMVVREGGRFADVARELTDYQNRLTKYLRDAGVLTDDAYQAMLEANKDYVPFFRALDRDNITGPGLSRGVKTKNPIKNIRGSEERIIDPLESVVKNTYLYLSLAERNYALTAFIDMANRSGRPGDFIEALPQEMRPTRLHEAEIRALFDEFVTVRQRQTTQQTRQTRTNTQTRTETTGADGGELSRQGQIIRNRILEALAARGFQPGEAEQMVARIENRMSGGSSTTEARTTVETTIREIERTELVPELNIRLPHEVATIWRAVNTPLKADEIGVFHGGRYQKYRVDPEVARAINSADAQTAGLLIKMLSIPAQMLRAGAVLSPDFMGRNFIRDQTMAFVFSKGGYLPVISFMRGAFSLARKDQDFQNWLKSGGANSAMIAVDRTYMQEQLAAIREVGGVRDRLWNTAKSAFEILRITSELIENATRLGEFKHVAGGFMTKEIIQEGGMAAREVTVDFARMGAKTRAISMLSAFLNPAIQGIDRSIRGFHENPVGTSAKMLAAITLPSILLYLSQKDDPRYKEIPQWQKDMSWIVLTDDHIYRIPKPHEAGVMFGSLPERMMAAFEKDNPKAFKDFEHTILNSFLPNPIPTVASPIVEQFANRSMFTGAPLIPRDMEKLLPEYQYTDYTTEAAKALGQIFGAMPGVHSRAIRDEETFLGGVARAVTTPALIENYVRSWTGGLGVYALQLADKALRETGVLPDPVKPLATLLDLPVVKAFVIRYPSASAQSIQDFYDNYYAARRVYDTLEAKAKEGDVDAYTKIQAANDGDQWNTFGKMRETITQQAQLIRLIYKNPSMTPEDKRQLIDTIYMQMIFMAQKGNEGFAMLDTIMGATRQ